MVPREPMSRNHTFYCMFWMVPEETTGDSKRTPLVSRVPIACKQIGPACKELAEGLEGACRMPLHEFVEPSGLCARAL